MSRRIFFKVLLVAIAILTVSVLSGILSAQGHSDAAFERVKEVQEKHTARLMKIKGVVGTAIGLDGKNQLELKVLTARPGVAGIAKKLDGVAVQTVVTGKIHALPGGPGKKVRPTKRLDRPVPIGVSTGNEGQCSAGTIGCRVTDGTKLYALNNNHVYALQNTAPIGSNVLQPGRFDAKPRCTIKLDDVIGELSAFEPIVFSTDANNIIDAAIAEIIQDGNVPRVDNATPSDGYGVPKTATVDAVVGQAVQKYGRTTSLTKGNVVMVNATVDVGYSSGTARFVDQIIIYSGKKPLLKSGDSGSLVVTDPAKNPVGLLFAGDKKGRYGVANPIGPVLAAFGVTIDGE